MNDWLHNLPIVWMALLVFGLTALVIAAIYVLVTVLSVGEQCAHSRLSLQVCCHRWASWSRFSLPSPPLRFGMITIGLIRSSIARLAL
jgi:hypothetical protein